MSSPFRARAFIFAFCLAIAPACKKRVGMVDSDSTVYVADRIRTLDNGKPFARAIAVSFGKITAVGSREEVLARVPSQSPVVALPGATIVPGVTDAHAHIAGLGKSLSSVDLTGAKSEEEAASRASNPPPSSFQGDWLIGRGWNQNDWGKRTEFPDRRSLDRLFPNTPVAFSRVDGHAIWANSEALRRAGITKRTADPHGGRIIKDAAGEPTGVLVDHAMELVEEKMPPPTDEQLQKRLKLAVEKAASVGLTSVHDAGMDFRTFRVVQQWDSIGALPIRVYAMATGQGPDAETYLDRGPFQGRQLSMRAVKFFMDGALGSRGAAFFEPYSDEPSNSGLLFMEEPELEREATRFMERGFQVCVHAIGDRANAVALDALSAASTATKTAAARNRIEHAQILREEDVPRFAKLGIIASMQPTHATSDMPWAEKRVGVERARYAYAWQSILKSGGRLAFGSDFPVEDPNPLFGIYSARTRQDHRGQPEGGWHPREGISGEQALAAFTTGAAYASFSEEQRGILKEGMDADFVAFSVDPIDASPQALLQGKVLLNVVAGREVFRSQSVP